MKKPGTFIVKNISQKEIGCQINYSELSNFFHEKPYRKFSIKYVIEGSENYTANGVKYKVNAGEYLLASSHTEGCILVKENQYAKGICIDLSNDVFAEVMAQGAPMDELNELITSNFFNSTQFLENKFQVTSSKTGAQLIQLHNQFVLQKDFEMSVDNGFYFQLIEALISDYIPIYKQLQQISSKKIKTRKDLWRKTNEGMNMLNELYLQEISVRQIARAIGLSEYYFFRLFKSIYQISPYQFVLNKRLKYATSLLIESDLNISEIADQSALGDIFSFSKIFKKAYGISPSQLSRK
ncbi:MAG: helix-turn-helix transcriptional regulator [Chitinophagaceae bacterium]|nr:helix-turn-helix transcriptional regulator [Chitinophagaceae bacterium]